MNNPQQTPLEKLISDKERIQRQCKRQEQKLNEDFSYIQENAGSLLLSGLSSLLFPSNKSTTKTNDKNTAPVTAGQPACTYFGSAIHVAWICRLSFCGTRLITCCMGCCTPIIDSLGHPESPGVDNKETFQEKEISCNN